MNRTMQKGLGLSILCLLVLGVLMLSGCPNKGANGGSGGNQQAASQTGQPGGGDNSQGRAQFAKFRDEHKYTFELMQITGKIGRLEKEGIAPLTPAQAKSILAVLTPLRTKTTLSQDEAKEAIKGLNAVLTVQQLTEMDKMQSKRRGGGQQGTGGGQPAGAPGGPGGPGGRGGQGGGQRPHFEKNFNPFNMPKDAQPSGRADRMQQLFTTLETKAKG